MVFKYNLLEGFGASSLNGLQMQLEESGNGSRTQDHGYKFKTGKSLNVHLTIIRSKKLVLLMELI